MKDFPSGESLFSEKQSVATTVILYILIAFLVGMLLFYHFIAYSPITGNSMENTVFDGQCAVLQRNGYSIERGDIVTVDVADEGDEPHSIIKRVIGKAGDRLIFVRSEDNRHVSLYLCKKGESHLQKLDEPYIKEQMRANVSYGNDKDGLWLIGYIPDAELTAIDLDIKTDGNTETLRKTILKTCLTVPDSHVFFLGDNRNNSSDSRRYGTQPTKKIIGKVLCILDKYSSAERFMSFLFGAL